jgi:hypothetical protein
MKVSSRVNANRYTPKEGRIEIEFALPNKGGNSSAGEKYDFQEKSVRLAWWTADGRFDPISTAEMPEWAAMDVIEACAKEDFFSIKQANLLIQQLSLSIGRQAEQY